MLYGCTFQNILLTNFLATTWSYNPTHAVTWMVWAVRPLKRYASWVQNVVRQFGPYLSWAQEV